MRQLQVIKIGTSSVFCNGAIDYTILSSLGYDLAKLTIESDIGSVLVVSGAIRLGMKEKGITEKPRESIELQSCARIGQPLLMEAYTQGLRQGYEKYTNGGLTPNAKLLTGQYLLTYHNLDDSAEMKNIVDGIRYDLAGKIFPLINYNDGVDPTEVVRDNDNLAARLTKALVADRLVIMTDVDGLLDKENRLIRYIGEVNDYVKGLVRNEGNGVGSMRTKLEAAELLLGENIPTIIGNRKYGLVKLIEDEELRTMVKRNN